MRLHEQHRSERNGWLRAAVLGANDGIVSTSSLIIGVAAANPAPSAVLLAGLAGLVAGAVSMAAGEYVSVSSQADTERADIALERLSLLHYPQQEQAELSYIYQQRGLSADLADQVAEQLMQHDALAAHTRDDIGLTDVGQARPVQAALSSAATFTLGAALPLIVAWLAPMTWLIALVAALSLLLLTSLGAVAAWVGGAPVGKAAARVAFWGILAMLLSAGVGHLFGVVV